MSARQGFGQSSMRSSRSRWSRSRERRGRSMTTLFVLDVPENVPVADVAARDPAVTVDRVGPYFQITAAGPIVIDRRATGCLATRRLVHSSIAGLVGRTHHPARQGRRPPGRASMSAAASRLGPGRWVDADVFPVGTIESTHQLTNTQDDAKVSGVLRTVPGASAVVCVAHPRQDVTHHVLVPELLAPAATRYGRRAPARRTTTCRCCTSRRCSIWPQVSGSSASGTGVRSSRSGTRAGAPCSPFTISRRTWRRRTG